MSLITQFILAIGLAMDAFVVCITNTLTYQKYTSFHIISTAIMFGIFQGIMPLLGYITGIYFSDLIKDIDHLIAFSLLCFLGIKMITEGLHQHNKESLSSLSISTLIMQALATSIDAMAIGLSYAALSQDILIGSLIICITTLLICLVGGYLGKKFSSHYQHATLFGGFILIFIGIKILIEHLFI